MKKPQSYCKKTEDEKPCIIQCNQCKKVDYLADKMIKTLLDFGYNYEQMPIIFNKAKELMKNRKQ